MFRLDLLDGFLEFFLGQDGGFQHELHLLILLVEVFYLQMFVTTGLGPHIQEYYGKYQD